MSLNEFTGLNEKVRKVFYSPLTSIILLILLTYAVYQGSLNVPFMWDDDNLILRDEQITSLMNIPRFFSLTYWKEEAPFPGANFRPLRIVSFAIDYFPWGYNPYGYHLTNLSFHIFNVLLIYFFVHLLLQPVHRFTHSPIHPFTYSPFHTFTPLLSALLFATHPIHTEAVVWIKNRSELFSTFFFLSSLILFIKSQTPVQSSEFTDHRSQNTAYYLLSTICFVFALLSKETAITLPLILVFYSFFFLFPDNLSLGEKGRKIILRTLPFWVIGILYAVLRFTLLKGTIWSKYSPTLDLSSRILLVIKTVGEYLKLLLFPVNLLAERFLGIPKSMLELDVVIYAVAIILLLISVMLLFRRAKPVSLLLAFALFWIFFTILPAGNIYYLDSRPLAEQRLYLPSVGFCILLTLVIAKTAELVYSRRTSQRISWVLCILMAFCILVPYSVGTLRRVADWQEPLRFWEKTAKGNPGYWRPQMNLGLAYMYANKIEEGIQRFEQALALNPPKAPQLYFELGFAYERKGKIEEATAMFEKGISLLTSDVGKDLPSHLRIIMPGIREIDLKNTEFFWGCFYQMRGLKEKAIEYYKKALNINPAHGDTHYNMAQIYENERQYSQAIFHYEQVVKVEPGHREIDKVYFSLGKIYRLRGEPDKAITYWEKTVEIKPDSLEVRMNIAELYKEIGKDSEAIEQYKKATEINPKNWDVYFNIGLLYEKQGLYKEASEYYEKAVKYNPNFVEAHYQLGLLYLRFRRFNDAAQLFQRIIYLDPTDMRAKKMNEVALKSAKPR